MTVGIVHDYVVLFAFESVEWGVSPPAGFNSMLYVGVSSCSDEEVLEPREVFRLYAVHFYLFLIIRESYNLISVRPTF
tara:strand:+ start:150 stop:383 length:234 start_codon:yes stop_codon:yes gene_type:complete